MTDVSFSPFNDNLLASASEDASLKLWFIDDQPMKEHRFEADGTMTGHTKKVLGF